MIPGNPYADRFQETDASADAYAIGLAVLALAHEQHQRNRLAALTYQHRGHTLPTDLAHLGKEER